MTDLSYELLKVDNHQDTQILGVLNVTPDSFSDGGAYLDVDSAVARGLELVAQGADIVDVGGESTRPGATRVSPQDEIDRVGRVIEDLAESHTVMSVDTMRAEVARFAVERGASIVNDVSGGLADPRMFETVAELDVPIVIMHWRTHSKEMGQATHYDDVVTEVCDHLARRTEIAIDQGIDSNKIIIDPGLGFAKEQHHNWELLRNMNKLTALGFPVLIGASRKRFLRNAVSTDGHELRAFDQLQTATDVVSAFASLHGAWGVRVHDVCGTSDALKIARHLGRS